MTNPKPLLSVVVPVYNVEKHLSKCVDSILAQTYRPIEIVLVDDGSTDHSGSICDDYERRYENIRVIHQANAGLSMARNNGVDASVGEYIGFVDSDDSIMPTMYEELYQALVQAHAQISLCNYVNLDEAGNVLHEEDTLVTDSVLTRQEMLEKLSLPHTVAYISACTRLYARFLLQTVRFPMGRLHEDEFTAHLFYGSCERIATVGRPLYCYIKHSDSIMGSYNAKHLDGVWALYGRYRYFLLQNQPVLASRALKIAYSTFRSWALKLEIYRNRKEFLALTLKLSLAFIRFCDITDGIKIWFFLWRSWRRQKSRTA